MGMPSSSLRSYFLAQNFSQHCSYPWNLPWQGIYIVTFSGLFYHGGPYHYQPQFHTEYQGISQKGVTVSIYKYLSWCLTGVRGSDSLGQRQRCPLICPSGPHISQHGLQATGAVLVQHHMCKCEGCVAHKWPSCVSVFQRQLRSSAFRGWIVS